MIREIRSFVMECDECEEINWTTESDNDGDVYNIAISEGFRRSSADPEKWICGKCLRRHNPDPGARASERSSDDA